MTGLPARLDHWASRIRNPEHLPGGDVRHDGFTDREAMELSTLLTEAANNMRSADELTAIRQAEQLRYEQGYRDGESSLAADWDVALDGVLVDGVSPVPTEVASYIELLLEDLGKLLQAKLEEP